jgi:dTDP-4-dehydrorhamnose reductase
MKIVIIGGTGILGNELSKIDNSLICIDSKYDIYDFKNLEKFLDFENPDIIINCAVVKVDDDPISLININIIGSSNISKYCINNNKRLVYISTDYVYPGIKGNYSEDDTLLPNNNYAWSKLSGEVPVKLVKNHLIIRTSFGTESQSYEYSYTNLYTSKDYVDVIAPMILNATKSNYCGVLNIGTDSKSIYEYSTSRKETKPIQLEKPRNFSLNTKLYERLIIK